MNITCSIKWAGSSRSSGGGLFGAGDGLLFVGGCGLGGVGRAGGVCLGGVDCVSGGGLGGADGFGGLVGATDLGGWGGLLTGGGALPLVGVILVDAAEAR